MSADRPSSHQLSTGLDSASKWSKIPSCVEHVASVLHGWAPSLLRTGETNRIWHFHSRSSDPFVQTPSDRARLHIKISRCHTQPRSSSSLFSSRPSLYLTLAQNTTTTTATPTPTRIVDLFFVNERDSHGLPYTLFHRGLGWFGWGWCEGIVRNGCHGGRGFGFCWAGGEKCLAACGVWKWVSLVKSGQTVQDATLFLGELLCNEIMTSARVPMFGVSPTLFPTCRSISDTPVSTHTLESSRFFLMY